MKRSGRAGRGQCLLALRSGGDCVQPPLMVLRVHGGRVRHGIGVHGHRPGLGREIVEALGVGLVVIESQKGISIDGKVGLHLVEWGVWSGCSAGRSSVLSRARMAVRSGGVIESGIEAESRGERKRVSGQRQKGLCTGRAGGLAHKLQLAVSGHGTSDAAVQQAELLGGCSLFSVLCQPPWGMSNQYRGCADLLTCCEGRGAWGVLGCLGDACVAAAAKARESQRRAKEQARRPTMAGRSNKQHCVGWLLQQQRSLSHPESK